MNNLQSEEKINERCPCCDKEIKLFKDYPLLHILSASVIKPEEVPNIISDGESERLDNKGVSAEVVSYFNQHPEEFTYAYTDGYIYERHQFQQTENSKVKVFWSRTKNMSDSIKRVVRDNCKRFLEPLERIVGTTIPTKQFIDEFETEQGEPKEIAQGVYLMLDEGTAGEGFRTIRLGLYSNPVEMGRLTRETLYTQVLENFATVKYIGKMLNEK